MLIDFWRHTATQDLLYATHYNYDIAAQILGWKSTEVMKKSYGKIPDDERTVGLIEAMGLPVVKEKREFYLVKCSDEGLFLILPF
jgi:hypothetical protein